MLSSFICKYRWLQALCRSRLPALCLSYGDSAPVAREIADFIAGEVLVAREPADFTAGGAPFRVRFQKPSSVSTIVSTNGNGVYMCNEDLIDSLKGVIAGLLRHSDELRNKFNEVEEDYREGNLDGSTLAELNQIVHKLETDSAAFERILGE